MRSILKQSSWLFLAQLITRVISFFYIIYLAKSLGVDDFGLLTAALAYFAIISSIADLGFNRYLIREIANDKSKAAELLCNIVMLRLTITASFYAIFAVLLYIFDPDKERTSLILLATLTILPQAAAFTFDAIFVAVQKLQYSAIAFLIANMLTAWLGISLVSSGFGAMGAVNALLLGQLIYALLLIILLFKNQGLLLSAVKLPIIKKALIGSLPYGFLGVLGLLYFRIDALMLSYLKGSFETGIYGAAYKFLEAAIFIPGVFSAALFPALAKLHGENKKNLKKLYLNSIRMMLIIGCLLLFAYLIFLPPLIKILLPQYSPAIEAIKILAFSIPFIFIATPGVQVLFSTEKYLKTVILLSLLTVGFNIILNLIFIPKFGFIAASWITVLSDILSFVIFYLLIKKKVFADEKD